MAFKKIQRMNRYTRWSIFGQKRSFSVQKVIRDTWRSKKFREWTAIQSEAFSGKSGHFRSNKLPEINCVQKNSVNRLPYKVRHFRAKAVIFGQIGHQRYMTFRKIQRIDSYRKWGIFGQKRYQRYMAFRKSQRISSYRKWGIFRQKRSFSVK